jgi:multiple sugar transport system substrate-binding protein
MSSLKLGAANERRRQHGTMTRVISWKPAGRRRIEHQTGFIFPWRFFMTKRKFVFIPMVALIAIGLAACSRGGAAGASGSIKLGSNGMPVYNGPAVTLSFWSWVPGIDQAIAAFEKAYPKITVKWDNVGNGTAEYAKLVTALQAGSGAPDVAQIEYQALPTFISQGGLVDLAKHGVSQVKDQFVPWTWSQVSRGDSVYAIPQDTGPLAFAYRKDIYAKYHLSVPKTWEEFAAEAKKLHDATHGKVFMTNFDAVGSGNGSYLLGLVWADSGSIWKLNGDTWSQSLNGEKEKKVADFWANLIHKGYVGTVTTWTSDWYKALGDGEIASAIVAAWSPLLYANNLGPSSAGQWQVAPLPQWPDVQQFTSGNWGGSTDAVTAQSKNILAATIFSVWINMNTAATDLDWLNGGLFPAAAAGLQTATLHDTTSKTDQFFGGQDVAQVFADASKAVDVNFQWAPWYNLTMNDLGQAINDAVAGKTPIGKGLDAAQADIIKQATQQNYKIQ